MPVPKVSLVDEYLDISKKSIEKYGEKTLTVIQAGSFYEVYDYDRNCKNFDICEKLLHIRITRKNSAEGRKDSAFMAGIPDHSFKKYETILLANQYTVVYVDQVSQNPIVRKITKVISPGCGMDDDESKDAILASCLIEQVGSSWFLSVSTYDSNRGDIHILNSFSGYESSLIGIFEAIEDIISKHNVNEIIFNILQDSKESKESKESKIEIPDFSNNLLVHTNYLKTKEAHEIYLDINSYIPKMLQKFFPKFHTLFVDIIDSLGLQEAQATDIGNMILMLEFIENHEKILIENLQKPTWFSDNECNKNMKLFNHALLKLQVISHKDDNSLFSILNKTLTCSGKKKLQKILVSPSCESEVLTQRYDSIDFFIRNQECFEYTKNHLKLLDLERIYRKFAIGKIDPYNEIHKIYKMNHKIMSLLQCFYEIKGSESLFWIPTKECFQSFEEYTREIENVFDIENCEKGDGSVFKVGVVLGVDELWESYNKENKSLDDLRLELSNMIQENINLKYTERDGYYFETTKKRGQKLEAALKKSVKFPDMKVSYLSSQAKISSNDIKKMSDTILILKSKIEKAHKEETNNFVKQWYQIYYDNVISKIIDSMSWLDVFYASSVCVLKNNYTRPNLIESENSFVKTTHLRHPIIEQLMIHSKNKYVPNDVDLSPDNSYLIYGVNSVGKSSLLKSVGLSIIMAQAGLYVPASEFEFSPYEKICIRIGNNDDLFNAHSSFVCEIKEANQIVKHASNKTLVLADEMCCSTEIQSATTIVSSTLQWLDMKKSSYVFASHFFELLDTCKDIKSMKVKHLKVKTQGDTLIFERTLSDGPPEIRNYGTIVASKIFQDPLFLKMLKRNESEKKSKPLVRKSKYNKNDIRISCEVCGYQCSKNTDLPLDTHHIDFQCNANVLGFIGSFHKDVNSNLVSLCKSCHIETHRGNIKINGWQSTDKGACLDFVKI